MRSWWVPMLGIVLAAVGPAAAEENQRDLYVGVRAIGAVAQFDGVSSDGFAGSSSIENDDDEVAGAGVVVGYRWPTIPLRTELEAAYRFRFDFDARDGGPPAVTYEANVATASLMVNAILEWRNTSDLTPFIGGSIGWAHHFSDTTRIHLPSQTSISQDADTDSLAWGGLAGVDWRFAEAWSAELAYRFLNLGEVDGGSFSGGDGISADEYLTHDLLLTVSYHF